MKTSTSLIVRFYRWRLKNLSERNFVILLSGVVGICAGLAAVLIKNTVWLIQGQVERLTDLDFYHVAYFLLPAVGIALALLLIKFVIRHKVRHGISNVLYSISRQEGKMNLHNLYSSLITSALTVGFGGSVGLEGPTVATGSSLASYLSRITGLNYRQVTLLMTCGAAGTLAAIFKAPVAAIVFAVEVILIDLTTFSLIPLLFSSVLAFLTSWFFLGGDVLYPFDVQATFVLADLPFYILLGILAGLVSAYFSWSYQFIHKQFDRIKGKGQRFVLGSLGLGLLIFLFPSLYGEGYESINSILRGDMSSLYHNSIFTGFEDSFWIMVGLLLLVALFKVAAASLTLTAGGIGGIFAPTLFMGVHTGMLFASIVKYCGIRDLNTSNFALIGMGGLIAGVLHAPLTAIFLIADISGGYKLFVPLMITSAFAFLTVRYFVKASLYHHQLAERKELITHHRDQSALRMMRVSSLIERDFRVLSPECSLRHLTEAIEVSSRNLFPVVDADGIFKGMVILDDVRHLIFKPELYDTVMIKDLIHELEISIDIEEDMEEVAEKFKQSGRFNIAVLENGKYLGFISRAKVFSSYREKVKAFSSD